MSPAHVADTILIIYIWIAAVVLIAFLFLIARFFQRKSGQRTYYQLFIIPTLLFLTAGLLYAFRDNHYVGYPIADSLLFLAGAATMVLGAHLFRLMTGGRR